MINSRRDDFFVTVFVGVVGLVVWWWASARPMQEGANFSVPNFSLPSIEIEIPFELP